METLFVVVAGISLLCAITVTLRVRQIGWAVWLWFFSGWITGELAAWCLGAQIVFVALWVMFFGTGTAGFALGLTLFLATWALLLLALRDGFDAGAAFSRAMRMALGPDFMERIPSDRRAKLEQQIHSREWLWPFRFRRPAVRYVRNIPYSSAGKRGLLDIYVPVTHGQQRPVLLQVHGGAWMVGHKSEQAQPLLHRMVELGWVGVSINYRLAPRDAYPAQIIDVKKAIAWVKENIAEHGGDPNFIVVTGGSAGGHLSLLAGLTGRHADWQHGFEAAIRRCRACSLCIQLWISSTGTVFVNKTEWMALSVAVLSSRPEKKRLTSLRMARPSPGSIALMSPRLPPFCIVQGTHDSLVWVEEVRRFVAEFAPHTRVPLVYAELPRAQHAFEIFTRPEPAII